MSEGKVRLSEIDEQIRALIQERRSLAAEVGSEVVFDILRPIFEFEGVESVFWKQYTPSFCDGDPCEFNVYFEPYINYELDRDGDKEEEELIDSYTLRAMFRTAAEEEFVPSEWATNHVRYLEAERRTWHRTRELAAQFTALGWTEETADRFNEVVRSVRQEVSRREDLFRDVFDDGSAVVMRRDGSFERDEAYA